MPPTIIALHGLHGSGKDTVADILVKDHGFIKTAFADPIRNELVDAFRLSDQQIFMDRTQKDYPSDSLSLDKCTNDEFVKLMTATYHEHHAGVSLLAFLCEPRSPRWVMERWGVEFRREHQNNQNYWIDIIKDLVDKALSNNLRVVISDLRDIREYQFVKELSGETWLIKSKRGYVASTHATATPLAVDFDQHIDNDRSIEELCKQVSDKCEENDFAPSVAR